MLSCKSKNLESHFSLGEWSAGCSEKLAQAAALLYAGRSWSGAQNAEFRPNLFAIWLCSPWSPGGFSVILGVEKSVFEIGEDLMDTLEIPFPD